MKLSIDEDSPASKGLREKYASIVTAENQKDMLSPVPIDSFPYP